MTGLYTGRSRLTNKSDVRDLIEQFIGSPGSAIGIDKLARRSMNLYPRLITQLELVHAHGPIR